mgnify:CR=1 FL=1
MKEKLTQLLQEGKDRIDAVRSEAELQEVKALLLGKQGSLTGLLKELPKLDAALRPEMGKAVNQAKAQLTALLDQRREGFHVVGLLFRLLGRGTAAAHRLRRAQAASFDLSKACPMKAQEGA